MRAENLLTSALSIEFSQNDKEDALVVAPGETKNDDEARRADGDCKANQAKQSKPHVSERELAVRKRQRALLAKRERAKICRTRRSVRCVISEISETFSRF